MSIPTWQYKIEEIVVTGTATAPALHKINEKLDALGVEGWEAVTNVIGGQPGHVFVLFKRQGPQSFNK